MCFAAFVINSLSGVKMGKKNMFINSYETDLNAKTRTDTEFYIFSVQYVLWTWLNENNILFRLFYAWFLGKQKP
jgi:hypothetical protein